MHGEIISDGESAPEGGDGLIAPKRRGLSRPVNVTTCFIFVVLVCDPSGYWKFVPECDSEQRLQQDGHIVGLGLTRWVLRKPSELPDAIAWLANCEHLRSRAQKILGYVAYPVFELAQLLEPVLLPAGTAPRDRICLVASQMAAAFDWAACSFDSGHPRLLHEWVDIWTT